MATLDDGECSPGLLKFFERSRGLLDREAMMKGLRFQPRPSDVLLTTGPKCGTSWVQHILHGLRSGGNIDFDEIDTVVPFVELYYRYNEQGDLDASQPFEPPRFFRMHADYEQTPGFNKRIVLTRSSHIVCLHSPYIDRPHHGFAGILKMRWCRPISFSRNGCSMRKSH